MNQYPYGEDETEEEDFQEPLEDDDAILRRYEKLKIFRKTLSIVVIAVFVGVFVAPELTRHLKSIFAGPVSADYLSLVEEVPGFGRFNPGVVRYGFEYKAHLNPDLMESTFSEAAVDWERALNGTLKFRRAQDGEALDLVIEIVDNLPHPGRSHLEYIGNHYRPRVELNAPDLVDPRVFHMVVAHELGHVLGIWGHSDYQGDLMYPQPERDDPSPRDARTIRLIYGLDGQ
jgi:hypothetical protein